MPKTHEFIEYLLTDPFSHISGITAKAMFGGYSLYRRGSIFAIVDQAAGKVYFKATTANLDDFQAYGCPKFSFTSKAGKTSSMNYYELPLSILENPEELQKWTEKAYEPKK